MNELKEALVAQALAEGFSDCRICEPGSIPHAADGLRGFLGQNYHGSMQWLETRSNWRANPHALWPKAQSIVMLTDNYGPAHDPLEVLSKPSVGSISVYAQGDDYHDTIKKRLKRLGRWLIAHSPGAEIKVFVDTAPVMEKPLGQAAGIGWQGKHTNLVSRSQGSWVFLGAIFTTLALPADAAEQDHCGNCRKCLDICPTDAFPNAYQLDARRCISYLTIEHEGPIAPELRRKLGNRIYGCDDCLAVCPWNKFAQEALNAKYFARDELREPSLEQLAQLDDTGFRALFSKSPIKRIGVKRFLRNVLYAIGNSDDPALARSVTQHVNDADPVVRDAALWALARLARAST